MNTQLKVPKIAIIPITYNCNAKCIMCNIWKEKQNPEIAFNDLLHLFQDPLIANNLESVNLTGGEPLLRTDLVEVAKALLGTCSKLSSITINSNGFLTDKILNTVRELCALRNEIRPYELLLFLSLDGMYGMHDQVRGVSGGFDMVMKTLRGLQELKKYMQFSFSVNFTINSLNYMDMKAVYKYINQMNIPIDFTYNMSSPIYFQVDHSASSMSEYKKDSICNALKEFIDDGDLLYSRSYYKNLIKMIKGSNRKIGCIFTDRGFFLHPNGDIYRCWAFDQKLGNIYHNTFTEIWDSSTALESSVNIKAQCETCYNNCYSHFLRIDSVKSLLANSRQATSC